MNAVTEMPTPLVFSESAAEKVRQLIEEEGNNALKLRVFVTGGGCSGFQYGFAFEASRLTKKSTRMMRPWKRMASPC